MEHKIFPVVFVFLTITAISSAQYDYPDLAGDANIINFADFTVFAENWQKTGTGLAGDFDDSGKVDFNDLAYLSYYWLTAQWECRKIDLDYSGLIDFSDFVIFADCWLAEAGSPNYNTNCDFDDDEIVDIYDLKAFCDCWLKGTRPQDIWEQFKSALAVGDIDRAVSYISEISRSKYYDIFVDIESNLPGFAAGMGQLILISSTPDHVKYEMLHQNGGQTYSFPVTFVKEDDGNWKIFNF